MSGGISTLIPEQLRIANLIAYRASLAQDSHSTGKSHKLKWLDEQISTALGIPTASHTPPQDPRLSH